ncbi:MAG: hypothetical protein U0K19_02780 [Bifidobacteriaceae bacterium]|nr:hypothetical protein [Bifidobacteriaceae bacterium]
MHSDNSLRRTVHRIFRIILLTVVTIATVSACGQETATPVARQSSPAEITTVRFFVPQQTFPADFKPVNSWAAVTQTAQITLKKTGFATVSVEENADIEQETAALRSWSQSLPKGNDGAVLTPHIAVIAPAPASGACVASTGAAFFGGILTAGCTTPMTPAERNALTAAVTTLKKERIPVISIGDAGIGASVTISMPTPKEIGIIESTNLVGKLKLSTTSFTRPRQVLVLTPYMSETVAPAANTAAVSESGAAASALNESSQQFFDGVWSVLKPYFKAGAVEDPADPSLTVDAQIGQTPSAETLWLGTTVDVSSSQSLSNSVTTVLDSAKRNENAELSSLQKATDSKQPAASSLTAPATIDGVIAATDSIAQKMVAVMGSAGYSGSASSINPEITLNSLVNTIIGSTPLQKTAVPAPLQDSTGQQVALIQRQKGILEALLAAREQAQWPVITGFGAATASLPDVLDGKQWMTGIVSRRTLVTDIANACHSIASDQQPTARTTAGPAIEPIDESNLKSALIDPGYVAPVEVGL